MEKELCCFLGEGFEDYFIDTEGNVFSFRNLRKIKNQMKPDIDKDGYEVFRFSNQMTKERKAFKAHRLVALAFIKPIEGSDLVNHINGRKNDNRVENLEWVTNQENILHAYKTGLAVPYIRGIKILDIHKNQIVSMSHNYDFLMEQTGLSYAYLIELNAKEKLLYDGYKIIRNNNVDYTNNPLFNKPFIKRTINQRFNPLKYKNQVYPSISIFLEQHKEISRNEFFKAKKNISKKRFFFLNNEKIQMISLYEYVNY